jgi:hypothetical protein
VLLFLRGSARLRPETPDLTIRLVLQDRVLTATTRRTLSDTALVTARWCKVILAAVLPIVARLGRARLSTATRRSQVIATEHARPCAQRADLHVCAPGRARTRSPQAVQSG